MNTNPKPGETLGAFAIGAGRRRSAFWIRLLRGISALSALFLPLGHAAQSVTLAWDVNSEPNIEGYVVRYGTTRAKPNHYTPLVKKTTATVSNLGDNTTYYFTVVARNTLGLESLPSNEVSYLTPPLGAHKLTVINGTGSGYYTEGLLVPVSANQPEQGQQFERWIGDHQILLDPTTMRTKALMLFRDLKIEASYNPASGNDKIRYHPRSGWAMRMAGGVFEGTNEDPVTGAYSPVYTIRFSPPPGWSEVSVNLRNLRYLRYRGPKGSYGNVAEIEFYRNGVKVSGNGYGTPGSWKGNGNNFSMALDGNVETRFDGPTADGVYVGIDSASDKIRYYPRPAFAARMVGGVFEGTNGDPTTGKYTPIYAISSLPPEAWSEVSVNLGNFRYLRYRGSDGSYGNVAEIEFYRNKAKVTGTGYGTRGSWKNNGNTFQRALDGDVRTRFDGPHPHGVYVGIDTASPATDPLARK